MIRKIERIKNFGSFKDWIEKGIELHKGCSNENTGQECFFCKSVNVVNKNLIDEYEKHFDSVFEAQKEDRKSREFSVEIGNLIKEVEDAKFYYKNLPSEEALRHILKPQEQADFPQITKSIEENLPKKGARQSRLNTM